jgi:hypothetical protein
MGEAYTRLREKISASKILIRKSGGKRLLVRPRHGEQSSVEIISKK